MDEKALAARLNGAAAEVTALSWACFEAGKMQRYYELQGEAAGLQLALSILNDGSGA